MKEFLLSRAEMLALMTAVNTSLIPLIDNDRLVPDAQEEQRALALQGLQTLKERGLLREDNGSQVLNGDLGLMAAALAYPQVVTLITRDVPGAGQQQFIHYRTDPVNAELTLPAPTQYRLAAIPDAVASLARVRQILPVTLEDEQVKMQHTLAQEQFFQVKSLAEDGQTAEAMALLHTAAFDTDAATQFVQTLQQPELGGTIAFMRVQDQQVVDGRNLALVQDEQVAWLIYQSTPGEPTLTVETVTAVEYSTMLLNTLDNLLQTETG